MIEAPVHVVLADVLRGSGVVTEGRSIERTISAAFKELNSAPSTRSNILPPAHTRPPLDARQAPARPTVPATSQHNQQLVSMTLSHRYRYIYYVELRYFLMTKEQQPPPHRQTRNVRFSKETRESPV